MQLGRKVTSHHDIDRFGVASTADESVYRRCHLASGLRRSISHVVVAARRVICTNHGSVSVQFKVWMYP